MANAVATQQALRHLGATYQQIAAVMQIHPRTAWQHIQARKGANVKAWDDRDYASQVEAIESARAEWRNAVRQGRINHVKEEI